MNHKLIREFAVWGTVVSCDSRDHLIRGIDPASVSDALDEVEVWLREVDDKFSTYKPTSLTSRYRAGEDIADLDFQHVLAACQELKAETQGAFDPWAVPGGFDPSGYVKGWATDEAATILGRFGLTHFQINAGGDVVVRGGRDIGQPWRIGVVNPHNPHHSVATVELTTGCVATSGLYERGQHIVGAKVDSATVVGPDAGVADALSTALMVLGTQGIPLIAQRDGYSGMAITGSQITMAGPAFV